MADPRRLLADADALEREAEVLESQARVLRESARQVREAAGRLPNTGRRLTVDESMTAEQKSKIAASRNTHADPFTKAMLQRGYSLRSLAKAVGVSAAHLSSSRAGRDRVSPELRERLESLIGERWPGR